jgi:N-sulfoglucosamine sulfohydrolase
MNRSSEMTTDRKKLNVLWLVAEDMGRDLGCYGEPAAYTPNLDRLAREGTRFERAYCTAPVCSASRSGFITGVHATTFGAHHHRTADADKLSLPQDIRLVSHQFADAGYHTCLMNSMKEDWNFVRPENPWMSNDWRDRSPGQPFFAMVNFPEPHRWHWGRWPEIPHRADASRIRVDPTYPDTPVQRESCVKYHDFVTEMDRCAGVLIDRLRDAGELDNTVVFFFGDNGRTMYADKRWCHEGGLIVPLVARLPGVFAADHSSSDVVSLIDLLPTCLRLCDIRQTARTEGHVMREAGGPGRDYAFGHRDRIDEDVDGIRAVIDRRFKLIRNYFHQQGYPHGEWTRKAYPEYAVAKQIYAEGGLDASPRQARHFRSSKPREELYDLMQDPTESDNLIDRPELRPVRDRLREKLDAWMTTAHATARLI